MDERWVLVRHHKNKLYVWTGPNRRWVHHIHRAYEYANLLYAQRALNRLQKWYGYIDAQVISTSELDTLVKEETRQVFRELKRRQQ